jgi:hypothetical protein
MTDIYQEYETSNPLVRDELAKRPYDMGSRGGDFVAPDFPVEVEKVSTIVPYEHKLSLDTLRAAGSPAKMIRFGKGSTGTLTVVEHAQRSTTDSREIEAAAKRDPFVATSLITDVAEFHRNDILDGKEYRIASAVTDPDNFDPTHTADGINFRTANLIDLMDGAQDLIKTDGRFGRARRATIGRKTLRHVRKNEGFAKFCASNPGLTGVSESGSMQRNLIALAAYLELEEIRLVDFSRVLEGDTNPTDFWPDDHFLLFGNEATLSTKTFAQTMVVPYGQYQGVAEGTLVDVRVEELPGTTRLTEVGAFHRYQAYIMNANRAYLWTNVVGT